MIAVAPALRTEIDKLRGRKLTARVRIDYSDISVDGTISAAYTPGTNIEQIYDGILQDQPGFVTTDMSAMNGNFVSGRTSLYDSTLYGSGLLSSPVEVPEIVVTFTPRTFQGVQVTFDTQLVQYGVDFKIQLKSVSGAIVREEAWTGNTGTVASRVFSPVSLVASLTLIITKWSSTHAHARVIEFFSSVSETYGAEDIMSLTVSESRENTTRLPIGTTASGQCVVVLYNRDRKFDYDKTDSVLFNLVRDGVRITPEIGDGTNWVPMGVFFARAWDISKKGITATVTGLDYMANLGESDYQVNRIIEQPDNETEVVNFGAGTLENAVFTGGVLRIDL